MHMLIYDLDLIVALKIMEIVMIHYFLNDNELLV